MNEIKDRIVGACLSSLGDVALASWRTYRLLFAPFVTDGVRRWVSRQRAAASFWNARRRTPAYAEFLREHGVEKPHAWSDIPPMDKDTYIRKWPLEATCQGGHLPLRGGVIDESSGSSGTATNWARGPHERYATRRLIQFSARATFGEEPFLLLNAFALGPWATGMNVSMSLVDRCVVKSIGPDARKIIGTLELLGPKYRYVITGYPPFLKVLVETADIDWKKYEIHAVVGGEGMSEPLRAVLNRHFRKTVSSFGASDLEINMAVETDFTIALRQALGESPALARDLLGEHESVPMIFQYDPLNYFIESDPDRNLLFTLNRLENVSPRIRYNIHDRGITVPVDRALGLLRDHGVAIAPPRVPLPLLCHWGRMEHAVAFYGCKITPEDIQHVLLRLPPLADAVGDFAIHHFEDERANKRLEIWLDAKEGATVPDNLEELARAALLELANVNQDFRESIKMVSPDLRPTLRMWPHGQSPLAGQDPRIKKKYIL